MAFPTDFRSARRQSRPIEIYNNGSGTITAFGAFEIEDVYRPDTATSQTPSGGREVWKVKVPSVDCPIRWGFNTEIAIAAGKFGVGTKDLPALASVASGVAAGDPVGIKSGTCELTKYYPGFIVDGDVASNLAEVCRCWTTKIYAKTPADGIDAATSGGSCGYVTPGSASCVIWAWSTANSRFDATAVSMTIYNFFITEVPGDTLIIASPGADGRFTVDAADCDPCS